MGMEKIRDEKEISKILEKVRENSADGLIEENIKLLREAVKRYPNNYTLLAEFASNLSFVRPENDYEEHKKNCIEAISIAERIISECPDTETVKRMESEICYFYLWSEQKDKAKKAADKLPSIWQTKDIIMISILEGDELMEFSQNVIYSLINAMSNVMKRMSDLNGGDTSVTCENRIRSRQKIIALYKLIFENGDYNFFFSDISRVHRQIAAMAMLTGDRRLALESIEKAAESAEAADNIPDKAPYTSLLVNRLCYNKRDISKNFTHTCCAELLECLDSDRFDGIRNDPRFKAVIEKL